MGRYDGVRLRSMSWEFGQGVVSALDGTECFLEELHEMMHMSDNYERVVMVVKKRTAWVSIKQAVAGLREARVNGDYRMD